MVQNTKNAKQPTATDIVKFEKNIISCILNDPTIIDDVIAKLELKDFSDQKLRCVFQAIIDIHSQGKPVDHLTVCEYISKNDELASLLPNYRSFIYGLYYSYTTSLNLGSYIDLVKESSIKNQLNYFAENLISQKVDFTKFKEQSYEWLSKFSEIINSKKVDNIAPISNITSSYRISLNNIINSDHSKLTGISSGFKSINRITDGFQRGDLIILAARPGTGKTALALNFILNAAKDIQSQKLDANKKPGAVVLFSIEMSAKQVLERMLASESYIDITKIKRGDLVGPALDAVQTKIQEISELPIFIDDTSNLSILDIQAKLKQIKSNYDIRLVVVDYLQLLKGTIDRFSSTNRQQEVANISRMLKIIAREINTPIMALAQLSRKIEDRAKTTTGENPKPLLSDLRESGAIEQDADIVTFLYYKNTKEETEEEEDGAKPKQNNPLQPQPIEYIIEKHRNGATGSVSLAFIKSYGKFVEFDNRYKENNNE